MMNQKAYLNHLINNKQYLQTFQINNINIGLQKIKLPFASVAGDTMKLSSKPVEDKKKQRIEFSPTFRKDGLCVVESLCIDDMKNHVQSMCKTKKKRGSEDGQQNVSNFYRSNSLPMKTNQIYIKNGPKRRLSTQNNHYHEIANYRRVDLPKIHFNAIPEQILMKSNHQRKKQKKHHDQSYIQKQKASMIRKCYESTNKISTNRSKSNISSTKRIKTTQQTHNEYMLQKILTAKPTEQFSRRNLDRKFELHRNYQRIREHKNCVWAGFQASMHNRSRTVSVKPYIKL